jgi:hypothetical protein
MLVLAVGVLFSSASSASAAQPSLPNSGSDEFTICKRADGSVPSTIDLLLLFDNSKSLNSKNPRFRPSDKENTRFDAVERMFEAIGEAISESDAKVNLGLIKFGTDPKRLIGFNDEDPISTVNARALATKIRRLLPPDPGKQDEKTDYIKALDAAQQMFEASDSANCRVMVWFTDGAFDSGYPSTDEKAAKKLEDLRENTCAANGWPNRFRQLEINSFVILLGKPVSGTLQASLELMQALTGHPNGIEGMEDLPEGCGGEFVGPGKQVGLVSRGSADTLGPLFEEIGTRIGGGKLLTACSETGAELQSGKMPASKFLKFVKLISRGGARLPKPEDLMVVQKGSAERPITDFMKTTNTTATSLQWGPTKETPISAGWQLKVKGRSVGLCLYGALVDPLTVKLTRVADGPVSVDEVDTSVLDSSDIRSIEFSEKKKALTPTEVLDRYNAAKTSGDIPDVRALLEVDDDGIIFPEQLVVNVQTDDPIPDFSRCSESLTFKSPELLGDMPKDKEDRVFRSTPCVIATRGTTTEVSVDASSFFKAISETKGCEDIGPTLMLGNKRESSGKGVIPAESLTSVSLLIEFKGAESNCKINIANGVEASFEIPGSGVKPRNISVALAAQLAPAPNPWWVILVTTLTVLLAALLSLILLRTMNKWLARLPEPQGLFSYELEITVDFDAFQSVVGKVEGVALASYQPQAKDLKPVSSGSASEMQLQSTHLIRRLPGLFRPFSEASAVVAKTDVAAYWQQTPSGGLAIPFSSAVILQKSMKSSPSSGVGALLTIVVPRNGLGSGIAGVEKILKGSKLSDLLKNFRNSLLEPSTESKLESSQLNNSNVQVAAPAEPQKTPPPPRPPLPPGRQ